MKRVSKLIIYGLVIVGIAIAIVTQREFGIRKGTGSKLKITTNSVNLPYVQRYASRISNPTVRRPLAFGE